MKKIIVFLMSISLIIITAIPIVSSTNEEDQNIINSDTYIEWPVMEEYIPPTGPESYPPIKIKNADLPSDFSWKDLDGEDWTSPINDQSACGSCWLFAAIGCLECILNVREGCPNLDVDLSEQYVMSCMPMAGSCRGGVAREAWKLINSTSPWGNDVNGILPEKCFGYQGVDKKGRDFRYETYRPVLCDYKCEDWMDHLIPAVTNHGYYRVDGSAENITRIKTDIMYFGPIVTSIAVTPAFSRWYGTHNDPDDYYPVEYSDDINHNVIMIGWKDDPAIPTGGYWRIKNTWGTSAGGYAGFFNIAYGSLHIDSERIQWVDYDPKNYTFKPIIKTNGPFNGNVGETLTFDGSETFGPETNITSYTWDFGDGATSTDVITDHTYTQPGSYKVTLTVEDDLGNIVTGETAALINLWEVGDSWTYNIDEISISTENYEFQISDQTKMVLNFDIEGAIENLDFTVSDITDEYYVFDFEGDFNGKMYFRILKILTDQFLNPGIMITRGGGLSGQIKLNKNTFGMDNITIRINGKVMPMLGRIPIPIPLPFDITLMNQFKWGFKPLDFPLSVGKKWDLRGERGETIPFSMKSKFESDDPNIMKIVEQILGNMGLPLSISMRIPGRSDMFECVNKESITTNLGTYECYNIAFGIYEDVLFNYYFAPEVGSIVKMSGDTSDFHMPGGIEGGSMNFKLNGELISTNYS